MCGWVKRLFGLLPAGNSAEILAGELVCDSGVPGRIDGG